MIQLIIPYIIAILSGMALIVVIVKNKVSFSPLTWLALGGGLGMGICGYGTFVSFLLFDKLIPNFVIVLNGSLLVFFLFLGISQSIRTKSFCLSWTGFRPDALIAFTLIAAAAVLHVIQASFYIHGGWDAWSTWNLKSKFLLLGGEDWKNMLDPILWRASPHYPLLLPLINVWGWVIAFNANPAGPAITAFLFTSFTVLLLYAGIRRLTKSFWSVLPVLALLTNPYFQKMSFSQYCDILVAFYLLATIILLIIGRRERQPVLYFLAGINSAMMGFSKSEGLVASLILSVIAGVYIFWKWKSAGKRAYLMNYVGAYVIFSVPTVLFHVLYSPGNQTFINGFTASVVPVIFYRLKVTLSFYLLELVNPQWNGVWIAIIFAFIIGVGHAFRRQWILIPAFLLSYMAVITVYYLMNTYFPIEWWLQVTLHRILYSVTPLIMFLGFGVLWREKKTGAPS